MFQCVCFTFCAQPLFLFGLDNVSVGPLAKTAVSLGLRGAFSHLLGRDLHPLRGEPLVGTADEQEGEGRKL